MTASWMQGAFTERPRDDQESPEASREIHRHHHRGDDQRVSRDDRGGRENTALFAAALLVAIGGLIYELILGTAASYLVGDSVLSFSLATGITLFGMGIGSLLASRVHGAPATVFAVNEILLGLVGGNSVLILYAAFGLTRVYWTVFGAISLLIGILIGLEIPLLVKTFAQLGRGSSVELLSRILAIDYFGALIASLLFPLVLLPQLGLMRGAYLVGALNVAVAMVVLRLVDASRRVIAAGTAAAVALVGLYCGASRLERGIDGRIYGDPVVYYEQTPYQKIVLTKYGEDLRMYLNGQLQFSSLDEARYHETLSASAMTSVADPARVLILGGGDGLLAREVLRYDDVERVTLVDIDPSMTELARTSPVLTEQNNGSLSDRRVEIVNADAFSYTAEAGQTYDVVMVDLVDPSNEKLAKLYSVEFYRQMTRSWPTMASWSPKPPRRSSPRMPSPWWPARSPPDSPTAESTPSRSMCRPSASGASCCPPARPSSCSPGRCRTGWSTRATGCSTSSWWTTRHPWSRRSRPHSCTPGSWRPTTTT